MICDTLTALSLFGTGVSARAKSPVLLDVALHGYWNVNPIVNNEVSSYLKLITMDAIVRGRSIRDKFGPSIVQVEGGETF